MRALGFEVKKVDVLTMFREVDKDLSHSLSFEEFVRIMESRVKSKDSREEIYKVFKLFDEDNSGKISFKNLKKIANELGENMSDEELKELIREADRDNDGLITFDDFYRVMRKNNNDPLGEFDSEEEY